MSKGNASKQRDEARERLKALTSAPTAPGQNQAGKSTEAKGSKTPTRAEERNYECSEKGRRGGTGLF